MLKFHMAGSIILAIFVLAAAAAAGSAIAVRDAWIREVPPNAAVLAGYLTLKNRGERPRGLVGAESPAFETVEMHQTVIENGRARMIAHSRLEIPARGELRFSPGGHHLMLIEPRRPLRQGDEVSITLCLDGGEQLETTATVKKASQEKAMESEEKN